MQEIADTPNNLKHYHVVTLDDYGFLEKYFVNATSSSKALQDVMTTQNYIGGSAQVISLVEMPDI